MSLVAVLRFTSHFTGKRTQQHFHKQVRYFSRDDDTVKCICLQMKIEKSQCLCLTSFFEEESDYDALKYENEIIPTWKASENVEDDNH